MATAQIKSCKDSSSTTRKLPYPGPRCTTCHSARKKALRTKNHSSRMQTMYNLSDGEYDALYEAQGGMCYTCGEWTGNRGLSKKLSVDHDHSCCPAPPICGKCIRGLICSPCNSLLGQLGDSSGHLLARLERLRDYKINPPAQKLLKEIRDRQTNS